MRVVRTQLWRGVSAAGNTGTGLALPLQPLSVPRHASGTGGPQISAASDGYSDTGQQNCGCKYGPAMARSILYPDRYLRRPIRQSRAAA